MDIKKIVAKEGLIFLGILLVIRLIGGFVTEDEFFSYVFIWAFLLEGIRFIVWSFKILGITPKIKNIVSKIQDIVNKNFRKVIIILIIMATVGVLMLIVGKLNLSLNKYPKTNVAMNSTADIVISDSKNTRIIETPSNFASNDLSWFKAEDYYDNNFLRLERAGRYLLSITSILFLFVCVVPWFVKKSRKAIKNGVLKPNFSASHSNGDHIKSRTVSHNAWNWLLWWRIDPAEVEKQVKNYNELKITESARGRGLIFCRGLVVLMIGLICFLIFFERRAINIMFGLQGDDIVSLVAVIMFCIILVFALSSFIYKGHRWASISMMILLTINLFSSPKSIILWVWGMRIFYFALRVENARRKLKNVPEAM